MPHGLREYRVGPRDPHLAAVGCLYPPIGPLCPQVKQLRLEREREKAMREQELEMLQREKEAEHFKTWEEQEDNFHLQQAKLRSVLPPPPLPSSGPKRREPCLPQGLCACSFHCLEPSALAGAPCPFRFPPITSSGRPSLTPLLVPTPAACATSCPLPSLSLSPPLSPVSGRHLNGPCSA